jgi:hypothetical protein
MTSWPFRSFPYLSERVWRDMAPSPKNAWTSATSSCALVSARSWICNGVQIRTSPSAKNSRIFNASSSTFRR